LNLFKETIEVFRRCAPLSNALVDVAGQLGSRLAAGGRIFTAGSGGSYAQAEHFAAELVGRYKTEGRAPLPCICLGSNGAYMSAVSNDFGYGAVFGRELAAHDASEKDAVVIWTTSGRGECLAHLANEAKSRGCLVVTFDGQKDVRKDWDSLHRICAPSPDTARIQEVHLVMMHEIVGLIEG